MDNLMYSATVVLDCFAAFVIALNSFSVTRALMRMSFVCGCAFIILILYG